MTKTVVMPEGWLFADGTALVAACGELEEGAPVAPAAPARDVAGLLGLETVGRGPVAVTWTVVIMVVDIWIVVAAAADWTAELVALLPDSEGLAPFAGMGRILVAGWDEADGAAPSELAVEPGERADRADWLDEAPTEAAAAVAPATLLEADLALAVAAVAVELNRLRREVFPPPMPTAGTVPVSFAVAEDRAALPEDAVAFTGEGLAVLEAEAAPATAVDDIEGQEVSATLEVALGRLSLTVGVAARTLCVTAAVELKRVRRDVLPPPTPTAGTLPASVPAALRGRRNVMGSRLGPAT